MRAATGNVYESRGRWFARLSIGPNQRKGVLLPTCATRLEAEARLVVLASIVSRLREARRTEFVGPIVEQAARATEGRLTGIGKIVDGICTGTEVAAGEPATEWGTFEEVANAWTSGDLHARFPSHVAAIDHVDNKSRLTKHVLPIVGAVPLRAFALAHAEQVMRQPSLRAGSRRHVAQLLHRVLALAVYPCRELAASPIPRGWLPKPAALKAGSHLYSEEDAALLADTRTPLPFRLLCGVLSREGMRAREASSLEWSDVELERGAVALDENKTDDPRAWALDPGVAEALRRWRKLRPKATRVFVDDAGEPLYVDHLADQLREALRAAGVTREALYERSDRRMRLRAHDLRATFVTLSLALGRTETWVADRTGHRSSQMIHRYRRAARRVSELGAVPLVPLCLAIPELAAIGCEEITMPDPSNENIEVRRAGLEPASLAASEPKATTTIDSLAAKRDSSGDSVDPPVRESSSAANRSNRQPIARCAHDEFGGATDRAIDAALAGDEAGFDSALRALAELVGVAS